MRHGLLVRWNTVRRPYQPVSPTLVVFSRNPTFRVFAYEDSGAVNICMQFTGALQPPRLRHADPEPMQPVSRFLIALPLCLAPALGQSSTSFLVVTRSLTETQSMPSTILLFRYSIICFSHHFTYFYEFSQSAADNI